MKRQWNSKKLRRNRAIFLIMIAVVGLLLGGLLFTQLNKLAVIPTSTSPTATSTSTVVGGITPSPTQQSNTSKLGWSTGYYVGWLETKYPPQMLPWKSLTYLAQFSLLSDRDGSLTIAHQLTPEAMQATVAEAHKHNVKVLITIGGADDENFDAACNVANRSKFVNNVVNAMQTYGYDGVDMDVERDFNRTDFANCFRELRRALNTITPQPVLAMAVVPEWQAWMAASVAQYVDQINLMSYTTNVNGMGALLNNFTSLGIPKSKLGIGLGLGDGGGVDTNAVSCDAKAKYAVDHSYGGVMEWMITDDLDAHDGQTPCLDAVSNYVS